MNISVIHPSRGRPQMAFETFMRWHKRACDRSFQYLLSIDESDPCKSTYKEIWNNTSLLISENKSAIEAINNAAKLATGDLLVVISDDFDCPDHWDNLLLQFLEEKKDFIVKTRDGIQRTLITLPIMDRCYYNRFGYIYHPDYLHMHCDEEMTIVAHMLGRVIDLPLFFPHNHYTTGKMEMDAVNIRNNATWAHGQATLDRHAKNNFGIANPLVRREDIVWR